MNDKEQYPENLRHSAAHLLAAAVLEIWPKAKNTIGPSIENGFYYDFDFSSHKNPPGEADLEKIEKKMHELVKNWKGFERIEVNKTKAVKQFEGNEYKKELIKEFETEGQQLTLYASGNFTDLCRGGHIEKPNEELKHFKLLSIAGAYWRGNEKNPMLTRIYGTAWQTKEELNDYLIRLDEAKKRDHKKIGKELELFMFDETSPGMPYWLPKGVVLYNELVNFWRVEHKKYNYLETITPLLNKKELYETSGHWEHYKNDMFIANMGENEIYGVKPMNCPNAMVIFGSKTRSYKDLPLRLSDTDRLHRYELSGTLNGLLRIRSFQQDDSHNFISEEMIAEEYKSIFSITERFYTIFGLDYRFRLGTRPDGFLGDIKTWNKAESVLKTVLEESGKKYTILEGDGAFYGPKVDIIMNDAIGREWQMGTIQLDFQQPKRFKLGYIDKIGKKKTPVVVHRVVYGSLERFIGVLIEHFAGAFPVWLSPTQVKVLPITDKNLEYANVVVNKLKEENIRVELDDRSETLGAKIRDAQNEKAPYMLIIGNKEEEAGKVAVRLRSGEDEGQIETENFIKRIKEKIENKLLEL